MAPYGHSAVQGGVREADVAAQEWDRQTVESVVEAAGLAPSVHNTQPWRFVWDGAALSVFEDPSRALPILDRSGRESAISCGAAALNARLALRALGWQVRVEVPEDPEPPELIARLHVGERRPPSSEEVELAQAIPRRHTDRGAFDPRPVPATALERMRAGAQQEGAWLQLVEREQDRVALAVLLEHADALEAADPDYQAELQRWRTRAREEAGVPDAALGEEPLGARASEYVLRDFGHDGDFGARPAGDPPPVEHPAALLLGTDQDERRDWVVAGMALGRVLLEATREGLAASPMTQVVEVERLRQRLRQELSLVGFPQVVLRVGYGHAAIATRRRPVAEVLEVV